MQVTDAMLDAAFDAYRAAQKAASGMDWGLRREFLQAALQAALDASPEQAMPQMWLLPGEPLDEAAQAEWDRTFQASRRAARAHLWLLDLPPEGVPLATGGVVRMATPEEHAARMEQFRQEVDEVIARRPRARCTPMAVVPDEMLDTDLFHNEGGDFLPGPKRYRTRPTPTNSPKEPAVADDTTKQPAPGFEASTPTALGSFTFPLDDRSAAALIDPDGVAKHLGVTGTQVDGWIGLIDDGRFPQPYKWVSGIPHWQVGTIDQWYALWKASNGG